MVEEQKKNSCYFFCICQVAQGSQSKTLTKRKVDLKRKKSMEQYTWKKKS